MKKKDKFEGVPVDVVFDEGRTWFTIAQAKNGSWVAKKLQLVGEDIIVTNLHEPNLKAFALAQAIRAMRNALVYE